MDEIRGAINLASMKEFNKELEKQIIREYEDDEWLILRPLTFEASLKYGSATKWCTTYSKEKQYFEIAQSRILNEKNLIMNFIDGD